MDISVFFCTFVLAYGDMSSMSRRINKPLNKVRITAIRQTVYTDLMERYENPIEHACSVHEGQQWIAVDGRCPEGFCPAAWETMRPFVESLARGVEVGRCNLSRQKPLLPKAEGRSGMQNPMSAMISCNDGFRPVSFYIEAIEEPLASTGTDIVDPQQPKLKRLRGDAEWRIQQLVRIIGKQVLPRRQIIADLGMRQASRRSLIDHYFRPAQEQGYIAFAYPGSPTKPEQAYKLTAKGLDLLAKLKEDGEE